jgi:tetratricopeptide (TPR) repeat protein
MTDAQALFERGHAALEAGDLPEAIECLSRAIAADPRVAAGYRLRAQAHRALGDRPKAIADLDAVIRLMPNDAQAIAERATELLKQRRYADAVADCDTALRLDPGRVDLFAVRGRAHALLGESAAAFADFERAIHADTDHAAEHLAQRAKLHLECGDARAAFADADAAARLDDDFLPAFEIRAQANRELGELARAADDFERAARDPAAIAPRLGRLFVLHDLGEWATLVAAADELLAVSNLSPALELRGRAKLALGDAAHAIRDFTELAMRDPRRPAAFILRAAAHEAAGDYPNAVADCFEALKRDAADADTLNRLAWLLATQADVRNLQQAKEFATRACELSGWSNADHLDTLAVVCHHLGDSTAALTWLEKAIAIDGRAEHRQRREEWLAASST